MMTMTVVGAERHFDLAGKEEQFGATTFFTVIVEQTLFQTVKYTSMSVNGTNNIFLEHIIE